MSEVESAHQLTTSVVDYSPPQAAVAPTALMTAAHPELLKEPIIYLPVALLIPNSRNARKHSKKQIAKIAALN